MKTFTRNIIVYRDSPVLSLYEDDMCLRVAVESVYHVYLSAASYTSIC